MPLTDIQARKAPAKDKDYKLADGGGLYLFVTTTGYKSWRLKYRFGDREKRLTLGPYPEVSIKEARDRRDAARRLLRDSRDPAIEQRKRRMAASAAAGATFRTTALEWHEAQKPRWSTVNAVKIEQALKRDVFPEIGALPLTEIDGRMVLAMLRKIEARGAIDTSKRLRQHVSAIFCYGIAAGLCEVDPAAGIKKALKPLPPAGRQPALKDIAAARTLLSDMERTTAGPLVKLASRLLALTAVRPGVVRAARWEEFEGIDWGQPDNMAPDAVWRVPAERMKLDLTDKAEDAFDHLVPLPWQAVDALRAVRRMTGRFPYLFHSVRSTHRPMSENTIGYMYARNGYSGRHVPHGWRSTFSTIMNEEAVKHNRPLDPAIIDGMLAHRPKGVSASEVAYNRAVHMPRRREIAQDWADMLFAQMPPAATLLSGRAARVD